jgi:hypothetical protein
MEFLKCRRLSLNHLVLDDIPSITDKALGYLKRLPISHLKLINCPGITDVGMICLERLPLEHLVLNNLDITDAALRHMKKLPFLKHLNLAGCTLLDGTGLEHLHGMECLKRLDLSLTNITGENLGYLEGLPYLEHLNLSSSYVTDAGLVHLTPLTV